jgi:ADP-heptose:LPS heptosyltransferase
MAPGSLQGFLFFSLLKRLGLLHYVVDFNLINADIITPPRGDYILDLHLNQVADLTRLPVPRQPCPIVRRGARRSGKGRVIGLHPWSRRGHQESFVWQKEKWLEIVRLLLSQYADAEVVVFGKDDGFDSFSSFLKADLGSERLVFTPSANVPQLVETIAGLDLLVSVNTAVVHIGHGLATPMVILCGPSLDLWVPKGDSVRAVRDAEAIFQAPDSYLEDPRFCTIQRINVQQVAAACRELLGAYEE